MKFLVDFLENKELLRKKKIFNLFKLVVVDNTQGIFKLRIKPYKLWRIKKLFFVLERIFGIRPFIYKIFLKRISKKKFTLYAVLKLNLKKFTVKKYKII